MDSRMTLDLDSITVTTFETATDAPTNPNAVATQSTAAACCGTGCNTRLTCSTSLC